jgi:hypothetical protein
MGLKKLFLGVVLLASIHTMAQLRISINSDVAIMRNFSPQQKFWTFGQTVGGNFHFTKKQSAYAWINYYLTGRFKNQFIASAKAAATLPSIIPYEVEGKWRSNEVSLGWKHYFKGSFDAEEGWNVYGTAGFGLMFVKVENIFTPVVDTSLYTIQPAPVEGTSQFKRLTFDLGLGIERPVGGNVYLFGDIRTWIPSSDYPSAYLHNNKNVPAPLIISAGIRILFGYGDNNY